MSDARQSVRKLPSLSVLANSLQEKGKIESLPVALNGFPDAALSPTKNIGRLALPSGRPALMQRAVTMDSLPLRLTARKGSVPSLQAIEKRFAKQDALSLPVEAPEMQRSKSSGQEPANGNPVLHPLEYTWTFYADSKLPGVSQKPPPSPSKVRGHDAYTASMSVIGKVKTVEGWASLVKHTKIPSRLPDKANVAVFKHDIAPVWEDAANSNGGKWTISCGECVDAVWLDLMLALVGGHLEDKDLVTGLVCNVRRRGNRCQIWMRQASVPEVNSVGQRICAALGKLVDGQGIGVDYSAHSGTLPNPTKYLRIMPSLGAPQQPLLLRSVSVPALHALPKSPLGIAGFDGIRPSSPVRRNIVDRSNIENVDPSA